MTESSRNLLLCNYVNSHVPFYAYTNFVATDESGAAKYDRSPIRGFFRPDLLSFVFLQLNSIGYLVYVRVFLQPYVPYSTNGHNRTAVTKCRLSATFTSTRRAVGNARTVSRHATCWHKFAVGSHSCLVLRDGTLLFGGDLLYRYLVHASEQIPRLVSVTEVPHCGPGTMSMQKLKYCKCKYDIVASHGRKVSDNA